jgi:hypothetical protein
MNGEKSFPITCGASPGKNRGLKAPAVTGPIIPISAVKVAAPSRIEQD